VRLDTDQLKWNFNIATADLSREEFLKEGVWAIRQPKQQLEREDSPAPL